MGANKLSGGAEKTIRLACNSARLLGHSYLGSGHLLLALTQLPATGQILAAAGLGAATVRQALVEQIGRGTPLGKLPQGIGPHALAIIAGAKEEAANLGCDEASEVHLLLAMLRRKKGMGYQILCGCGVAIDAIFTVAVETAALQNKNKEAQKMTNARLLEQFGQDMVEMAGSMEPVIGRQKEIDAVIGVLCRKNKNNPALIGEPGVGKTAIVEGLAQRMAAGNVPDQLFGKRLISIDIASLIAGTKYRGEFEERVRDIVAEVRRNKNVILFIDEMHTICGAGAAEGAIDAANLMKPALGRGEIQMIGATTLDEYRKYIEKDAALERRFRPVRVEEPSEQETEEILRGVRLGLERHHGVSISDEAIHAAVRLSCRYLPELFLPDKALDLLDESAARVRMQASGPVSAMRLQLERQIHAAVQSGKYEKAAQLQGKMECCRQQNGRKSLLAADVARALSDRTGIPAGTLTQTERQHLTNLEQELHQTVVGQGTAVRQVCDAVRRGKSGLADSKRPVATILLMGPSGVGKTELCKALAQAVYGRRDAMIRLDMSEYMEKISVSRLIGAPPGYVGHENGGELTEKVRRKPYSLILLDELEKAHPDVTNLLLQVMEDGVLTDAVGRRVDFCNTLIVMTSNLGSRREQEIGFSQHNGETAVPAPLKAHFPPEFLGRIDCIAQMSPLTAEQMTQIAAKQLSDLIHRVEQTGTCVTVEEDVAQWIAAQCRSRDSGARQIRHTIQQQVENPLAVRLLQSEVPPQHLRVILHNDGLSIIE